jgi:hypothetical protein
MLIGKMNSTGCPGDSKIGEAVTVVANLLMLWGVMGR